METIQLAFRHSPCELSCQPSLPGCSVTLWRCYCVYLSLHLLDCLVLPDIADVVKVDHFKAIKQASMLAKAVIALICFIKKSPRKLSAQTVSLNLYYAFY